MNQLHPVRQSHCGGLAGRVRVGAVNYLNTKPLVYQLDRLAPQAELILDLPSRLADGMRDGRLDVALIPSIEFFADPTYTIVSNACIACRGPVLSVKLFSRVPAKRIGTLALDEGSRTSVALARILLRERYGIEPRLEPLPTSDDTSEALQARVADPLWMLARQWQFNEFQGEDAGSPIAAMLRVSGVPITSLVGGGAPAIPLAGAAPIEALVEREQVLAIHPKLNAQAGQQLMRQLRAAGLTAAVTKLLTDFPATIEAPQDPVGDNPGFVWNALLSGKAVNALAVANALRPLLGNNAALDGFGTGLGLSGGQLPTFRTVATSWMQWLDNLAVNGDTPGASPYWNANRLEYSFALQADGTQPLIRLDADEYTDGKVD